MPDIKMFAAGLANGSHFDMRSRSFNFGAHNLINTDPQPGKAIGSPWNARLPSFRYAGHEAPSVNFTGAIDTRETALGSLAGGSLFITLARLGSMWLAGSAWILYPALSDFLGSPFSNPATGSVPSVINDVRFDNNTNYMTGSEYLIK